METFLALFENPSGNPSEELQEYFFADDLAEAESMALAYIERFPLEGLILKQITPVLPLT